MRHTARLPWLAGLVLASIGSVVHAQTPPQNIAANLAATSWQLVKFQGSDDTTLTPDDGAKYTIAFETGGRVNVRIDCNRGRGTWTSAGPSQLQFGPLALTRAACPPGSLHDRLARDLGYVRSFVIRDGHLFLALMADAGIYEFEPLGRTKPVQLTSPVPSTGPIQYECARTGGSDTLSATFYQTMPAMVLVERGNQTRPAFQVRTASGTRYEGQDLLFWDARGEAQVSWSGVALSCRRR